MSRPSSSFQNDPSFGEWNARDELNGVSEIPIHYVNQDLFLKQRKEVVNLKLNHVSCSLPLSISIRLNLAVAKKTVQKGDECAGKPLQRHL